MPGVDAAYLVVAQAHAVQGAGPKALDHYVGIPGQGADDFQAFFLSQVKAEAALVAVEGHELGAFAVPEGGPGTGLIPPFRLFDFDYVSAHVAQHHGAKGSGEGTGQIYDFDTFQRRCHG